MSSNSSQLLNAFAARRRISSQPAEYRQILPICTALEVHSYKNALQLCTKLVRKQQDLWVAHALKVFTLFVSSRPFPSASVAQEIQATVDFLKTSANAAGLGDPDVLMFLGWVHLGMGKREEQLDVLAKAIQRHSENEDVCMEAFTHYIRVGELKLAQQITMRMQRNFKSTSRYTWWSVQTILLQVRQDPTNSSNDLLLSLAERQISAHYSAVVEAAKLTTSHESSANGSAKKNIEGQEKEDNEKGKGKALDSDTGGTSTPSSLEADSITLGPRPLEFETSNEFHLITRFLELKAIRAESSSPSSQTSTTEDTRPKPTTSASAGPLVLPSLPPKPEAELQQSLTPQQALIAHFASSEGERWCAGGLGLEIWRRESELKFGVPGDDVWEKAAKRLRVTLENGDTNWHSMLFLVRFSLSVAQRRSTAEEGVAKEAPTEAGKVLLKESYSLFRGLADASEKSKKERGFLLALLEIEREVRTRAWEVVGEALPTLIDEYFERFGTKMCCFDDLEAYFGILTFDERAALAAKSSQIVQSATDLNAKSIWTVINAAKIGRALETEVTAEGENTTALAFATHYFETLPLGKGLVATELQPADDFALLSAQAFVSAWKLSGDRSFIEKAIAILDFASTRSKYKYQLRILLVNLTRLLGASSLAHSHFKLLGTKSIQHDTLSHVVLGRASTFAVGGTSDQGVISETTIVQRWYKTGEQEASEMPVRAFNLDNFTKIEDFVEFQSRLNCSLSKLMLNLEATRIEVVRGTFELSITSMQTLGALAKSISSTVTSDNRDFKTLPNHQTNGSEGIWAQTQMGPRTGYAWLRALATAYARFLAPPADREALPDVVSLATAELTMTEIALTEFAQKARSALDAGLESREAEAAALAFFKDQDTRLGEMFTDSKTLPWEVIHLAEIALEGYSLLDLAVDQKIAEVTSGKVPDHARISKSLRTFKTAAREQLRPLASKMNAYAKQVAKLRAKTSANVSDLTQFPLLDEDHLTNFAFSLVDSRKLTAEALASAIHKRCSGK
ncbi:actin cytoskeleton organization protein [Meredithblackwellia eburnea MCA 4105]